MHILNEGMELYFMVIKIQYCVAMDKEIAHSKEYFMTGSKTKKKCKKEKWKLQHQTKILFIHDPYTHIKQTSLLLKLEKRV